MRFYCELVGLPLYMRPSRQVTPSNGAIFGLPSCNLTLEIVDGVDTVSVDRHDQLCPYYPDRQTQQQAIARSQEVKAELVQQHPYWEATGAVTYREPDVREVVSRRSWSRSTSTAKAGHLENTSSPRTEPSNYPTSRSRLSADPVALPTPLPPVPTPSIPPRTPR